MLAADGATQPLGLFLVSRATSLEKTEPSNCVVFKENRAKEFDIEWAGNLKDGWTGVSGVQIVERPYTPQGIRID